MAERVGIVAVAQTKYHPNRNDVIEGELAYEVIKQVLEETGLTLSDIGSAVTCCQDAWEGRTIASLNLQNVVGAHFSHEFTVAEDGINAAYVAMSQILAGGHDIVLVVSHMKESQTDKGLIENVGFDPILMRQLGLDYTSAAALQARRYMDKYGVTPEQFAKTAVRNHRNARNNPYAQQPMDITVNDVLKSKVLVDPIKLLDAKPISDGACALIIAKEEKARKLARKPVWITGVSNCYETHYLGDRELADCDALVKAAKKAYSMAGIANPVKEIDLAEISTDYSYQEPLWLEGLGFCERGKGGKLVDSKTIEMGGQIPVNPSGGVLPGNPNTVAGMARIAEAVLQLRGEAGTRQVHGAKAALTHGYTGICGQLQTVMILANT